MSKNDEIWPNVNDLVGWTRGWEFQSSIPSKHIFRKGWEALNITKP